MPRTKRPTEWERLKLRVQPTPRNNWGDNLAHLLYKDIWDKLRKEVYKKADYRCEICGTTQVVFHCHENWGFNEAKRLQFLVSLQCLCPECHNTIHFYRTMAEARKGDFLPNPAKVPIMSLLVLFDTATVSYTHLTLPTNREV